MDYFTTIRNRLHFAGELVNYQFLGKNLLSGIALVKSTLFICLIFSDAGYSQTESKYNKSQAMHDALSEIVLAGKAPGIIAAIISPDSVIACCAAGLRKAGSAVKMTTTDKVYLGSCTKAMTAAMLATLVAEGKLRWDMTVSEAIPGKKIHPQNRDITLWELLTHRAGVDDIWTFNQRLTKNKRLELVIKYLAKPTTHKRGEFSYSNMGYITAAVMAEQITGLLWEDVMQKQLFVPLGMTSPEFRIPGTPGQIDQPWGHQKSHNGWHPVQDDCSEALGPAGNVYCTIDDWARFLSLFMNSTHALLSESLIAKLLEPTGFYAGGWGISEIKSWAKGKTYSHCGSNGRWYSSVLITPKLDRAFIVVTNSRDFGVTEDMCSDLISTLIRIELKGTNKI